MRKVLLFALAAFCIPAYADVHQAEYGVAATFNFNLYAADGTLDTDEADSGTEVTLYCDEGTGATATNDFVDEGTFYSIALTAAEMQCARIAVEVAATLTEVFFVETQGGDPAQIRTDDRLGITDRGTAQAVTSATITLQSGAVFSGNSDPEGQTVLITNATTGEGQSAVIASYNASTDVAELDEAWPTTPTGTVEYIVVGTADNTSLVSILADTNELQTDWANGGRLDLILDSRASQTSVNTIDDFVDSEVASILANQGTFTDFGSGATIAGNNVDIEGQTDDIGVAGAGLMAVPWNASWDAEVESEAADALTAYDPPTDAEMDAAIAALNDLDAAGIRTAVGLASADLDTQLAALPTAEENASQLLGTSIEDDPATTVQQALCRWNTIMTGRSSWTGDTASSWSSPGGNDSVMSFTYSGNDRTGTTFIACD